MDAPTTDLYRALSGIQTRDEGAALPTLAGHFAVFNRWTEISSWFEGNFLERIDPSAFNKTFAEQRSRMKVLYDHGHDPSIGNKPLGPIRELRADSIGGYYEVPLIDTDYNRNFIVPAVEADTLGASFRFRVIVDEWNDDPGTSDHNPKGLPERTIKESAVFEFGPVTFPAYPDGTNPSLRSLTDHYIERSLGIEDLLDDSPLALRAAERFPLLRTLAGARRATTGAAATDQEPHEHSGLTPSERARVLALLPLETQ